jgi:NitT/TauT family transport system ATP-binding protein
VLLFSPRPGRIRQEFRVDLPRPREFNNAAAAAVASEITHVLKTIIEVPAAA